MDLKLRKSPGPWKRGENTSGVVERMSQKVSDWAGSTEALIASVAVIFVWAVTGPYFHYSDTWQLVANTLTNLITFVMVFLIQRSQNKDSLAVQLKLNEIIGAVRGASNQMIAIENMSEDQLRELHERYLRLSSATHASSNHRLSIDQTEGIAEEPVPVPR